MSATDGLLGSTEGPAVAPLVADDLRTIERLARTLIAARDEYKTLVANPESLSSDIKAAATRCMRAGNAFFDEAATPERILSMVEGARKGAEDTARLDWLERAEVEAVYLKGGAQLNPGSMSVRAMVDFFHPIDAARAPMGSEQ